MIQSKTQKRENKKAQNIRKEAIKKMEQKPKKVGEIFSDYKTNANIKYAEVKGLNIIKKTNTLQVILYLDEYIEIKEIWYFENFLKERFKFQHIDLKIEYHEKVEKKEIQKEWKNIIAYMSHKYPLAKPMLLLKSELQVKENNLLIEMHIKGADFLKAKKTDKELQKTIKNLFGKEYTIEITEKISANEMKEIQETIKKQEEQMIAKIEEENKQYVKNQEDSIENIPEYSDPDYMPPTEEEGYLPEEMEILEPEEERRIHLRKTRKRQRKLYQNKRHNSK